MPLRHRPTRRAPAPPCTRPCGRQRISSGQPPPGSGTHSVRAINGFRLGGIAPSGTAVRCDELVGDPFPHLSELLVERVFFECGVIRMVARTPEAEVPCPGSAVVSNRVHSTYGRSLADTPVGDRPALIELTVRRLYCENVRCSQRTFAEQARPHTRRDPHNMLWPAPQRLGHRKPRRGSSRTPRVRHRPGEGLGRHRPGSDHLWNSGPVKDRVNHIKMIKRQMFGRAKLRLLRKRVLLTAAQGSHRHQA